MMPALAMTPTDWTQSPMAWIIAPRTFMLPLSWWWPCEWPWSCPPWLCPWSSSEPPWLWPWSPCEWPWSWWHSPSPSCGAPSLGRAVPGRRSGPWSLWSLDPEPSKTSAVDRTAAALTVAAASPWLPWPCPVHACAPPASPPWEWAWPPNMRMPATMRLTANPAQPTKNITCASTPSHFSSGPSVPLAHLDIWTSRVTAS
mmetsp:Transcript_3605/g.11282  ORF Transcript_3605/g.11282 Transcript_3605/m.11282 type:complete len:200 (-) Transcript_3605:501-1100(-)